MDNDFVQDLALSIRTAAALITGHALRAIFFTFLCLVALTSAVHAECAWVLWLGIGTTYTPFGAYGANAGEKECKEAVTQLMTEMRKDAKQLGEFLKSSSRYVCLPDTVDPRGPKGTK